MPPARRPPPAPASPEGPAPAFETPLTAAEARTVVGWLVEGSLSVAMLDADNAGAVSRVQQEG